MHDYVYGEDFIRVQKQHREEIARFEVECDTLAAEIVRLRAIIDDFRIYIDHGIHCSPKFEHDCNCGVDLLFDRIEAALSDDGDE